MIPHFARHELQCRCGCGRATFHPGFLEALTDLRMEFARPMSPTSAARCQKHNMNERGAARSFHICDVAVHPGMQGAMAIDIACPDGAYRGALFALAWSRGWSVGWGARRGFLHLDRRDFIGWPQLTFDY
jgi:hypothetical protein